MTTKATLFFSDSFNYRLSLTGRSRLKKQTNKQTNKTKKKTCHNLQFLTSWIFFFILASQICDILRFPLFLLHLKALMYTLLIWISYLFWTYADLVFKESFFPQQKLLVYECAFHLTECCHVDRHRKLVSFFRPETTENEIKN